MKKIATSILFSIAATITYAAQTADTILYNGSVMTMKSEKDRAQAIAISDGKILAVGNNDEILKLGDNSTQKIDLNGKSVTPGLTDTHLHFQRFGLTFMQIRGNNKSKENILSEIKNKSNLAGDNNWIRGRGWNETIWSDKALPTAKDIDGAASKNPVALFRSDNHALWVNSKALQIAGIDKNTSDPDGGKIIRDESGNPTGILVDTAMNLVLDKMPELTEKEMEKAYLIADKEYSKLGLTTIFDAGDNVSIPLVKKLIADGKIKTRVNIVLDPKTAKGYLEKGIKPEYSLFNDRMAIKSYKIKHDGALGSRGALMKEEYSDSKGNFGNRLVPVEELNQLVIKGHELGYQPHIHAIGDLANQEALDAYENFFKQKNLNNDNLRFGIVHSQIIAPEDIQRYKDMNIVAIMQPIHATSDMNMAEDRVGPVRIKGAYAWKTLKDKGVTITGGSDNPNDYIEPFYGIHAAVTRKDMKGSPEKGWYPEETVDLYSALEFYTKNAAYLWFMENKLGTLEPGKYADLIVLSENIEETKKDDLWKVQPVMTFINGEKVYSID